MLGSHPNVVITGVAMTTALAPQAQDTWTALLHGQSGIRPLSAPNLEGLDLPSTIGGQLRENLDDELSRVEMRRLSFTQRMAIVLSRRAWADAGDPEVDTARLGVTVGTGLGSTEDIIIAYHEMQDRGLKAVSPLAVQMYMPNGAAAAVGLDRKARAGVTAPLTGDVSGASAIVEAWRNIVFGDADIVICGGVELKLEGVPFAAYGQIDGVMSTENDDPVGACRPFDQTRSGMVLGEGGAMLIMETEEHARARGARVLARVLGGALSSDGYDAFRSDPDAEQEAHAISRALELAGLSPGDVDHVNAHATGTVDGDLVEAVAIQKVFGGHHPAVYASKAALGHSFGAAGAIEAVLTVLALRDGCIPPTLNLRQLDDRMDLDVVAGSARSVDVRYAVSNSFGFGGHNAAIAFGKA
ncbi:KasA/KasB family beta-ketoacyl-ACP synthase [Mycolicibacterium sediminis]|uniref:3-oxoacyl-ACP synthase n=1 Tax=Mycolicibacterium sediminis TaxID=1286180 RepID=A0A7I7QZG7_9MYCO|nr:KasA/KasB family beta-ketoacyl-ACP synthase [Mycolicibacterium sediminis]BBY31685.1 3-oxoacyl-ACP synthase [Mycolicibacterium sediminis]